MQKNKDQNARYTIMEMPSKERPREKLLHRGAMALTNAELLAILFRTGTRHSNALDLACKALAKFKSLRRMGCSNISDWDDISGVGEAKISQIKAAFELGRRLRKEEALYRREKIISSEMAAEILMPRMQDLRAEYFVVMYMNAANEVISIDDITKGTVNQANPIIREIFHRAIEINSVSFICAHNHPSGTSSPSRADIDFTRELKKASSVMGVMLLDHLIIASNDYFSFADECMV